MQQKELSQIARDKVAVVGELLIRAAAVIGTLEKADQDAISQETEGKLSECLAWAIEGAAKVNPQVAHSLKTHPPRGFRTLISVPGQSSREVSLDADGLCNADDVAPIERPPLNRQIIKYSSDPNEQSAYFRMQSVGFKVAEVLMQQPAGTMAADIQGYAYWVSPLNGMTEIFCTPDFEPLVVGDCSVFAVSDFEGQDADDLDRCRIAMESWLENPFFVQRNPIDLDAIVDKVYGQAELTVRERAPQPG